MCWSRKPFCVATTQASRFHAGCPLPKREVPEADSTRAVGVVSANRPTALEPGHPLHDILGGFSDLADDVVADERRDADDAAVDHGPHPDPSPGRPLDDAPEVPFTPPVPSAPLQDLVEDRCHDRRASDRLVAAARGWSDRLLTAPTSPRALKLAGLAAAALAVLVATHGAGETTLERRPPTTVVSDRGDGHVRRPLELRRRDRRAHVRRARHRTGPSIPLPSQRRVGEPRRPVEASSPARAATIPSARHGAPEATPSTSSRFTDEFTP
jgi:hypothetical protein